VKGLNTCVRRRIRAQVSVQMQQKIEKRGHKKFSPLFRGERHQDYWGKEGYNAPVMLLRKLTVDQEGEHLLTHGSRKKMGIFRPDHAEGKSVNSS